jgi:NAD-specific glutamate dehydrogenase
MTKAEKIAINARAEELIKEGVEKELAKVMAKVELETGLIRVVVNYN